MLVRRQRVRPFSHTCMSTVINVRVPCYPPFRQLHFDFGDFNNEVCHVIKVTVAESNPDTGLFNTQVRKRTRKLYSLKEDER